jgi:hypothetical protein
MLSVKKSVPKVRNFVAKHALINRAERHTSKAEKVGRKAKHKQRPFN